MTIKTLSALSQKNTLLGALSNRLPPPDTDQVPTMENVEIQLNRMWWLSVAMDIPVPFDAKLSLVKDLGDYHIDPIRVMSMLLLNLSQKDLLELRVALGIPELTQRS